MIRVETRRRSTADIDIAPLVDCVFLLLIFFLLTSSFSEKRGLKITVPRSATAEQAEKETIEITVSDAGEVMLDGRAVSKKGLTEALKAKVEKEGKKPVFMLADRQVPLGDVTEVMDSIRASSLETVSIATQRKTEGSK